MSETKKKGDRVWTPVDVAADMIRHFKPEGRVLEPFRGSGVFTNLEPTWLWCEVDDGRDFFDWREPVDWIVTNPPYSKLRPVWRHAATVATNIVMLIPFRNWVSGAGFVRESFNFGGVPHIRIYGTGSSLGFPMGNCIAAIHWRKGFSGGTGWSDYEPRQGFLGDEQ